MAVQPLLLFFGYCCCWPFGCLVLAICHLAGCPCWCFGGFCFHCFQRGHKMPCDLLSENKKICFCFQTFGSSRPHNNSGYDSCNQVITTLGCISPASIRKRSLPVVKLYMYNIHSGSFDPIRSCLKYTSIDKLHVGIVDKLITKHMFARKGFQDPMHSKQQNIKWQLSFYLFIFITA